MVQARKTEKEPTGPERYNARSCRSFLVMSLRSLDFASTGLSFLYILRAMVSLHIRPLIPLLGVVNTSLLNLDF